ncbi:MAG: hypothetical protein NTV32_07835 [Gammaproteobacteria bacterium]|nr:hypothetical protein [Gammaproteobacteria bacterium]
MGVKFIYDLDKSKKNAMRSPKLHLIKNEYFIFEPSDLFPARSIGYFYLKGEEERFLGVGRVDSVMSTTKCLQVLLILMEPGYDLSYIHTNQKNIFLEVATPYNIFQKFFDFREQHNG